MPFLRNVRDREAERRHKPAKFDFEDIPLTTSQIKELIIDEIMIWNPRLMDEFVMSHERRRSVRAASTELGSIRAPPGGGQRRVEE